MVHRATTARIALLALIWGSAFLWIKLAIRGLSPVEVTLTRLVLGSAMLFAVVAARRDSLPRSPVIWAHIVVAALFTNAAPYLLFAVAEEHVASSTAGMLNATTPLWTVVVALATTTSGRGPCGRLPGCWAGSAGAGRSFPPGQALPGSAPPRASPA